MENVPLFSPLMLKSPLIVVEPSYLPKYETDVPFEYDLVKYTSMTLLRLPVKV